MLHPQENLRSSAIASKLVSPFIFFFLLKYASVLPLELFVHSRRFFNICLMKDHVLEKHYNAEHDLQNGPPLMPSNQMERSSCRFIWMVL